MGNNQYYQTCQDNIGVPVEVHYNGSVHYGLIQRVTNDEVYLTPLPDYDDMNNNPGVYVWGLGPAAMGGGFRRPGLGYGGIGGGFGRRLGFPFSGISALYLLPFLMW